MTQESNSNKNPVNVSLILSVIAIIGLVILFVMEFTDKDEPIEKQSAINLPVSSSGSNSIVFVNSELILEEYLLVNKLTAQLEKESQIKDADLDSRQKAYEQDAQYFQQQVQEQSISEQSAQLIYEQLMMKQQELIGLQEQYASELAQSEYAMNVILLDSVRNYLGKLNEIYNYDYILSYNTAGSIILAKDTFDITLPVLEGLNREYEALYAPAE